MRFRYRILEGAVKIPKFRRRIMLIREGGIDSPDITGRRIFSTAFSCLSVTLSFSVSVSLMEEKGFTRDMLAAGRELWQQIY